MLVFSLSPGEVFVHYTLFVFGLVFFVLFGVFFGNVFIKSGLFPACTPWQPERLCNQPDPCHPWKTLIHWGQRLSESLLSDCSSSFNRPGYAKEVWRRNLFMHIICDKMVQNRCLTSCCRDQDFCWSLQNSYCKLPLMLMGDRYLLLSYICVTCLLAASPSGSNRLLISCCLHFLCYS